MTNQSIAKKLFTMLPLVSLLLVGAMAQGGKKPAKPVKVDVKVDCSAVTDADILKEVQDKIKADPKFKDQLKQINVSVADKVVTLNGWVKGGAAKATIGKYAKSAKCVKSVKNNLGTRLKVGCSPGQKLCGDICIDEKANCNIMN
ncbi:MAG: BON domain-containing protein [Acidobacteriota bacterium]|nr:BON domain-containing protein [Acidobacteriota bacterium]